ncbi:MAG: putative quinol monooxygenase [Congregibacter sp.]
MIVVTVIIESSVEDIAAMQPAIATMEQHSRAEAGCQDYTFSVELNRSDALRITERWVSEEALAEHMRTPHMATFQSAIAAHKPKSFAASFYRVEEFTPPRM